MLSLLYCFVNKNSVHSRLAYFYWALSHKLCIISNLNRKLKYSSKQCFIIINSQLYSLSVIDCWIAESLTKTLFAFKRIQYIQKNSLKEKKKSFTLSFMLSHFYLLYFTLVTLVGWIWNNILEPWDIGNQISTHKHSRLHTKTGRRVQLKKKDEEMLFLSTFSLQHITSYVTHLETKINAFSTILHTSLFYFASILSFLSCLSLSSMKPTQPSLIDLLVTM